MKNNLAILSLLIFSSLTVLQVSAGGQTADYQPTAEEKKAALDIADRFETRLDETSDIAPVIREMFVTDHVTRYVAEVKANRGAEVVKGDSIFFITGIEYSPALLDQ